MKRARHGMILLLAVLLLSIFFSGQAFAQVTGQAVANEALKYEGNRVVMGSAESVQYIYGKLGIRLPGTLGALSREGTLIRKGETLQPGDILFFGTSSRNLIAAGIFVGNNRFIISHQPYNTIRVMRLSSSEPARYYLGARRIIPPRTGTSIRDRVIREGLKYVGTPYEFNSNRSSTATMDCSDFVRRTYYDATKKWLPTNSRTQAAFVWEHGKLTTNWRVLRRGDLMFFTSPTSSRISHVAIYMGDGRILHSTQSRGVHVGTMTSYWQNLFYFGGNILD